MKLKFMNRESNFREMYINYINNKFFGSLDGLRFLCIVGVIWHHTKPQVSIDVFELGFLGVDFFFLISGFLIVTLLLREKTKSGEISLKKFYIRRALRIFPIYYGLLVVLAAYYALVKPDDPDAKMFFSLLPAYILFLSNWSLEQANNMTIYWSLAAEEQFYLIWPFIEKLKSNTFIMVILVVGVIFNQLINFGVLDGFIIKLYGNEDAASLKILDSTFTPILLGVLLAKLLNSEASFHCIARLNSSKFSSFFWGGALVIGLLGVSGDISGIQRLLIQCLMLFFLASVVVREDSIVAPMMKLGLIKRIGQISYGMYVYHLLVLHIVVALLSAYFQYFSLLKFLTCFAMTAIIAELSFRFYETPLLRLKANF